MLPYTSKALTPVTKWYTVPFKLFHNVCKKIKHHCKLRSMLFLVFACKGKTFFDALQIFEHFLTIKSYVFLTPII